MGKIKKKFCKWKYKSLLELLYLLHSRLLIDCMCQVIADIEFIFQSRHGVAESKMTQSGGGKHFLNARGVAESIQLKPDCTNSTCQKC